MVDCARAPKICHEFNIECYPTWGVWKNNHWEKYYNCYGFKNIGQFLAESMEADNFYFLRKSEIALEGIHVLVRHMNAATLKFLNLIRSTSMHFPTVKFSVITCHNAEAGVCCKSGSSALAVAYYQHGKYIFYDGALNSEDLKIFIQEMISPKGKIKSKCELDS